jgi:hypothetical protein
MVLLGYGVSRPPGVAGLHFQNQVVWLMEVLANSNLPIYAVGGAPRHPSRWQRWTSRTHPEAPFELALVRELRVLS